MIEYNKNIKNFAFGNTENAKERKSEIGFIKSLHVQ